MCYLEIYILFSLSPFSSSLFLSMFRFEVNLDFNPFIRLKIILRSPEVRTFLWRYVGVGGHRLYFLSFGPQTGVKGRRSFCVKYSVEDVEGRGSRFRPFRETQGPFFPGMFYSP